MADTSGREEEGFLTCEYGESDDAWLEKNTREIRSRDFERERGEGDEKKKKRRTRESFTWKYVQIIYRREVASWAASLTPLSISGLILHFKLLNSWSCFSLGFYTNKFRTFDDGSKNWSKKDRNWLTVNIERRKVGYIEIRPWCDLILPRFFLPCRGKIFIGRIFLRGNANWWNILDEIKRSITCFCLGEKCFLLSFLFVWLQ